jgi:hypothetical protein
LPTQTCGEIRGASQLCWRRFDCTLSDLTQSGAMFSSGEGSINPDLQGYGTCASGTCSTVDINGTGFEQAGGICHFADLGNCPAFAGGIHTSEGMCMAAVPPTAECRDFSAILNLGGNQLDSYPTECWYGVNCPADSFGTQNACHAATSNSCDGSPTFECTPRTGGCWECNVTTTTLPDCNPPNYQFIAACRSDTACMMNGGPDCELNSLSGCYYCPIQPPPCITDGQPTTNPSATPCGPEEYKELADTLCCSSASHCTPNQAMVCGAGNMPPTTTTTQPIICRIVAVPRIPCNCPIWPSTWYCDGEHIEKNPQIDERCIDITDSCDYFCQCD